MSGVKNELTAQEADLYDRQIRLWGLESQKKLRAADILLVGMNALGAEISKNILLAGIKSLTFLDDGVVTEHDLLTNFLLPQESLHKNIAEAVLDRARDLNSMVNISAVVAKVTNRDEIFYKHFTLIIATKLRTDHLISLNEMCRRLSIKFLYGDTFGMFGFTFTDLQTHHFCEDVVQFVSEKSKKRKHDVNSTTSKVKQETASIMKQFTFVPGQDVFGPIKGNPGSPWYFLARVLMQFRDSFGRDVAIEEKAADLERLRAIRDELLAGDLPEAVLETAFGQVVPVCAIIGGVLAQEVIKAVSHSEPPIHNMFFFDPIQFIGQIQFITNA